jgi:hypothetical protein
MPILKKVSASWSSQKTLKTPDVLLNETGRSYSSGKTPHGVIFLGFKME